MEQGNTRRAMSYVQLDAGSTWAANVTPAVLLRASDSSTRDSAVAAAQKMTNEAIWFAPVLQACLSGDTAKFQQLANESQAAMLALRDPEFRYYQGSLLAHCGDKELAMKLLRSAVDSNYCASDAFENDPALDPLRTMPDFDRLRVKARVCQRDAIGRPGVKPPQEGTDVTAPPLPQK
jgi:hypothetical protein